MKLTRNVLISLWLSRPSWALCVAALGGFGLVGCDDIIEPDITGHTIALTAPADNSRSSVMVQSFRWAASPDARTYHLQLVSPSFAATTRLVLDTIVRQTYLTKSLSPGQYEWRVQGQNAGYETAFASRTVFVDSTGSLTNQVLPLSQPTGGYVTNTATISLAWDKLPMAKQYRLSVSPNPRSATLAPLDSLVGLTTAVTLRLARVNQAYQWKVTAANATTQTTSEIRTFEIDVTPPAAPTLVSPAAGASFLTLPLTLTWTRAVEVAQDSVFLYRADQTTRVAGFPRLSASSTLTLTSNATSLNSGTYYWTVRSLDKAGNLGPISTKRAFVLQ